MSPLVNTNAAEQVATWNDKNVIQSYKFPIAWSQDHLCYEGHEFCYKEGHLRADDKILKLLQAWVSRFTTRVKKIDTSGLIKAGYESASEL